MNQCHIPDVVNKLKYLIVRHIRLRHQIADMELDAFTAINFHVSIDSHCICV